MACANTLALANYKKDWPLVLQVLANALVCRFRSLACDNPLASIAPPSDVTGLGIFVSLFGELSAFVYLVRESSYDGGGSGHSLRQLQYHGWHASSCGAGFLVGSHLQCSVIHNGDGLPCYKLQMSPVPSGSVQLSWLWQQQLLIQLKLCSVNEK
jgi:hypothetical protein